MIEISRLRKSFGGVPAVCDVSFTAPDGRITGLLGENGAVDDGPSHSRGEQLWDHGSGT